MCSPVSLPSATGSMQLRAVFLDIGDTVMRPNPSWEHVYAIAFEEYGVQVEVEALHAALRRAADDGPRISPASACVLDCACR